MKTSKFERHLVGSLALALATFALPAAAQTAPPASAPAAGPAATAAANPAPAAPRKRRAVRRSMALGCEPVQDPWENLCKIRKNAETACSDLAAPARSKAARRARMAQPTEAPRDRRQECIDAYMRNV